MSVDVGLLELLNRGKNPNARMEPSFCAILVFGALVLAAVLHNAGIVSLISDDLKTQVVLNIVLYVAFGAFSFLLWIAITQAYLRSGKSPKIGLIYSATSSDSDQIDKVRETVEDLYERGKLTHATSSIRYVPSRAAKNPTRANRYIARYDFDLLGTVSKPDFPV